jgi:cytochrome c oxidase cbb3-type subunit IV
MDVNDLRSIVTVLSMLAFAGIVAWTLLRSNRARFDEAAMLPFAEGPATGSTGDSRSSVSVTAGLGDNTPPEGRP